MRGKYDIPQQKMIRIFQMITMLKHAPFSVMDLSDGLKINDRTVYRYLTLLEGIGFLIDKDFKNRFFIIPCDSMVYNAIKELKTGAQTPLKPVGWGMELRN